MDSKRDSRDVSFVDGIIRDFAKANQRSNSESTEIPGQLHELNRAIAAVGKTLQCLRWTPIVGSMRLLRMSRAR